MRLLGSHAWRARATALLGALAIGTVAAETSYAQSVEAPPTGIQRPDGRQDPLPKRRGFSLFGSGDIATTGLKGVGAFSFSMTNYGPPLSDLGGTFISYYPQNLVAGSWLNKYFEITVIAGTPRSEFRKIRQQFPAIGANNTSNGYSVLWNAPLLGGQGEIGPSDNSLGAYFSGVQSTADGSCRDLTSRVNEGIVAGSPLLPMSDCPVTWGTLGWQGPRVVPDTAYRNLKAQLGDNFNWQFWSVDKAQMGGNLGNFSTFGVMTDHSNEMLAIYGGQSPKGSGPSQVLGYPLGLDFHFDALSFSLPALANSYLYQLTVVNNTKDVYGFGIDFDSLYAGIEMGFLDSQSPNTYYEPHRNAIMSSNGSVHGTGCNGTKRIGTDTPSCVTGTGTGFSRGAVSIVMLKSPIGDMRNKLYSKPGMFYDPANPHRGDTITFNHGHKCGYGACIGPGSTLDYGNLGEQALFGLMSSTGSNVLAGRSVNDLTGRQYFYTFRSWDYPTRSGKFNHFAPGTWDYNHDGIADTLFYDTCDESVINTNNLAKGLTPHCVTTWSDSTPGGFTNNIGNVGGMMTAGPFKLKAGDTTSFIVAFSGAPDSSAIEAATNNVIEGYLNYWAGPTPPTAPTVVATNVTKNSQNQPVVQITYSDAPEVWVDPFLTKYASDLATSTAPDQVRLRTLNPNLVSQIQARAAAGKNFNALYVYKSCNGGASWTADADCVGDPAIDINGNVLGNGWRPYSRIAADANGSIPNLFQDANVVAGRTYLYAFVPQSRGFATTVLDSVGGKLVSKTLVVADSLLAPVPTSGPNVANVYVPISLAAGTTPTSFTLTRSGVPASLPVGVVLSSVAQGGNYTAYFGNRFVVTDTTYANGSVKTAVHVQTFYPNAVDSAGNRLVQRYDTVRAADSVTIVRVDTVYGAVSADRLFHGTGPIGVSGLTRHPVTKTQGSVKITYDTLTGLGFLFARDSQPLYISASPSVAESTPTDFLTSPLFPGFRLNIDTARVNKYVTGSEFAVKPPHDTLPATIYNAYAVQWDEGKSKQRSRSVGQYEFTFQDDAYGPGAPFTLDFANPQSSRDAVNASLGARQTALTTDTTSAVLGLVRGVADTASGGAITYPFANVNLVPMKLPFTVRNVTFGRSVTVAAFARRNAVANNTVLLGNENDTLRVAIDSTTWVPGDTLVFIENITVDSMVGGRVVMNAQKQPVQAARQRVSFAPAVLDCLARATCNPVKLGTRGATGYLTFTSGTRVYMTYEAGFVPGSQFAVNITATQPTTSFTSADRAKIRVVPNPYIVQDQYDVVAGRNATSRVYFTNVPSAGELRIYSVSGQFLQQLDWTAADLNGTGDLPYNLRSREGTDLASGLYIWTIRAKGTTGKSELARGKFVVIR